MTCSTLCYTHKKMMTKAQSTGMPSTPEITVVYQQWRTESNPPKGRALLQTWTSLALRGWKVGEQNRDFTQVLNIQYSYCSLENLIMANWSHSFFLTSPELLNRLRHASFSRHYYGMISLFYHDQSFHCCQELYMFTCSFYHTVNQTDISKQQATSTQAANHRRGI